MRRSTRQEGRHVPSDPRFPCLRLPHRSRRLRACRRRRTGLAWLHSEQQQRSVLAVEQDAEAINKRYYDSAFEEFLPELEQLELSLAQPSSPSTRKACWATGSAARPRPTSTASIAIRTSSAASGVPTAACSWRRPAVRSGSAATCSAKARSATCSSAAPRSTTSPRWPSVAWPTARRLSPTWSRCCAARRWLPPAVPGTARRLRGPRVQPLRLRRCLPRSGPGCRWRSAGRGRSIPAPCRTRRSGRPASAR